MFEEIKNKVKKIIKDKNIEEINNNTDNKNIGIYMIYIDNFNDDKVIPIYIGQSGYGKNRNFQNRYKEHLQEIMALNRLEFNYYKELLLDNFYDGHYKACKIFQYMVDHSCTLKDFHMIVLEKIEENSDNIQELLDKMEQKYFKKYLPAFLGFNQINTVVETNKEFFENLNNPAGFIASDKLLNYELEDCENFIKYFGYGYTKFNYYHCYPKTYTVGKNSRKIEYELRNKKELLKSKYYDENKFKEYDDKLPKLEKKHEKNNKELQQNEKLFEEELNKNKEYVINLFELKEISSITIDTLAQYDNEKEFNDEESIEEIYEVFADKKTHIESVNDIPVNPDILYFVKFKNDSGNYKSAYIYKKDNQYYIEQPYNGIYQVTEDEYTRIEKVVK